MFDDPPPFATHALPVAHGHVLHVQESGRPDGIAALVLHGGPGSGSSPLLRRFLDPSRFRIVSFDQRGAGRSTPRGDVAHNTTAWLLDDLRLLRRHLRIDRWLVVGGSWGATLALAHALDEPAAIQGLLLRAVFLATAREIESFFAGSGVAWQRMADAEPDAARELARAWHRHESQRAGSGAGASATDALDVDALVQRYRIQSHFLRHACWLDAPPLLQRCAALPRVPALLLQGTHDRVCPVDNAQALQRAAPHVGLRLVEGVGHDPTHPAMAAAMVEALAAFAARGRFTQGVAA